MNGDTAALVLRPYGELVDDILTSVVGGVVNEPIVFDVKVFAYPLAEPADAVRGITGTAGREHRAFLPGIDFVFGRATNVVTWLDDGTRPDDGSTFFVDYFRQHSRSPITDINVGSVTRTLTEAIGREIATVYQQINLAYLSGFVDTATGKSLDYVVAILGVVRKSAEFAEGLVTFFRSPTVDGNITIPAGTLLATGSAVLFTSTELRTLQRGQVRIDVPVRADLAFPGEAGRVPAGAVTELTQAVAGIERVSNLDPTILGAADETDDELRARAKAALRAFGKATLAALDRAIREARGVPVEFFDPNGPPLARSAPGTVTVVVDAEPERLPGVVAAVHDTRAAGVLVTVLARYVFITPRVTATVRPGLSAPGLTQVAVDVVAALQGYVDSLTSGDPADGATMLARVRKVADVTAATIVDVVVARADLSDPLAAVARVPDRSLLESTATGREGQPASDDEIEAGTFRVSATVAGDPWWIALDMSVADVRVEGPGAQG